MAAIKNTSGLNVTDGVITMANGVYAPTAAGQAQFVVSTTGSVITDPAANALGQGLRTSTWGFYSNKVDDVDNCILNVQQIQRYNTVRSGTVTGTAGGASSGTGPVTWTSFTSTNSTSGTLTFAGGQQTGDATTPTQATGTWAVSGGGVLTITLSTGGANYSATPTLTFAGSNPPVLTGKTVKTVQVGKTNLFAGLYCHPDNGGDCSAVTAVQTGGGNALTAYKVSESLRPTGFANYADSGGYAAEFGTSDQFYAVGIFANGPFATTSNVSGGLLVNVPGANCKGILVSPNGSSFDTRIAYGVGTPTNNGADTQSTFQVDFKGSTSIGGPRSGASGQLDVGGTYTDTFSKLAVLGTLQNNNTSQQNGFQNQVVFNPTGASLGAVYGLINLAAIGGSSLAISAVTAAYSRIDTTAGFTGSIGAAIGVGVGTPQIGGGGITTLYGIRVEPQTSATFGIGVAIGAGNFCALWMSENTDSTTTAGGILWGATRDTTLYRSAASTLKTDGAFVASSINCNGVLDGTGMANTRLASTVTTTSSTIGTNALTNLGFAIGASQVWSVEWHLTVTGSVDGMKFDINGPTIGAGDLRVTIDGNTTAATAVSSETITAFGTLSATAYASSSITGRVTVRASINNGSTAGTVQLRFASATNTQSNSVLLNSYMVARRTA